MAVTIGFIMSENTTDHIKQTVSGMEKDYTIRYLTYINIDDVKQIYLENENEIDGFIFSGELIYRHFKAIMGETAKPCFFLNITKETIITFFMQKILINRNIDLSRIFIDCVYEHDLWFKKLFKKNLPLTMDTLINDFSKDVNNSLTMQKKLWNEGKIDLSITRLGENLIKLKNLNIPVELIIPSSEDIRSKIKGAVRDIELLKLRRQKIVLCRVHAENPYTLRNFTAEEKAENNVCLKEQLKSIANRPNVVIQQTKDDTDIIFYNSDVSELTKNFTICPILSFADLPFSIKVSISVADDIKTAKAGAESLYKHFKNRKQSESYVIMDNGDIYGPISKGVSIKYSNQWDPEINVISKRSGIGVVTLKKIKGIIEEKNDNLFTSKELSDYLNISLRSSNRILKILVDTGFATILVTKPLKQKGRPEKKYQLYLKIKEF